MNIAFIAFLLTLAAYASAQQIYCYPASVQSASNLYISFDSAAYKYSIPDLNRQVQRSYNQHLCYPATLNTNFVTFAASSTNTNSTNLNANDLTVANQHNSAAPYRPSYSTDCVSMGSFSYCFMTANNVSFVQRKVGQTVVETLTLPIYNTQAEFITTDPDVAGRIHLATKTCQYRGCSQLQYYALAVGPLRIYRGPKALPNTVNSGCPVEPASCGVDVVITGTLQVRNDIVSYIWSISQNNQYKVTVVTYDARCDSFKSVALGQSLAAAARCGTTTSGPTTTTTAGPHNCWTCLPGYVHWYDIPNYPEPADKCACVYKPTSGPTTTTGPHNCWTCLPGYVHWYDIPNYPEPADKCACIYKPTSGPTTTTTTAGPHNCWTCLPGYVHWYDIPNYPEPADKCACVYKLTSGPTTTTPAGPHNCWTCLPGYVHWYDIPNYPEPADKCACIYKPTSGPTTTTTAGPHNCWTCLPGYVHWYDIPNYPEPADKCACVYKPTNGPTTTQGPTTTHTPTRNCWTCAANYVHWYDIPGYPEPTDKCACVYRGTTTRGPTTSAPTHNCWTCLPGYVHWYDIPNYPEPADKCACVRRAQTRGLADITKMAIHNE